MECSSEIEYLPSMGKAQGSILGIKWKKKRKKSTLHSKFNQLRVPSRAQKGQPLREATSLRQHFPAVHSLGESVSESTCRTESGQQVPEKSGQLDVAPAAMWTIRDTEGGSQQLGVPETPSHPITVFLGSHHPPYLAFLFYSSPLDFVTFQLPQTCCQNLLLAIQCVSSQIEPVTPPGGKECMQSGWTLRWVPRGSFTGECPQTSMILGLLLLEWRKV